MARRAHAFRRPEPAGLPRRDAGRNFQQRGNDGHEWTGTTIFLKFLVHCVRCFHRNPTSRLSTFLSSLARRSARILFVVHDATSPESDGIWTTSAAFALADLKAQTVAHAVALFTIGDHARRDGRRPVGWLSLQSVATALMSGRRGRPPNPEPSTAVQVRMSAKEYDRLYRLARQQRISIPEVLRRALCGQRLAAFSARAMSGH